MNVFDLCLSIELAKHKLYLVKYFCNNCRRNFDKTFRKGQIAPDSAIHELCGVANSYKTTMVGVGQ